MRYNFYVILILIISISCQSKTEVKDQNSKIVLKKELALESKSANKKENRRQERDSILNIKSKENKEKQTQKTEIKDKKPITTRPEKLAKLLIDDELQYSKNFISFLRKVNGMEIIEFKGGLMILNQKDSINFPEIPEINKKMVFTGRKQNLTIVLIINRINYTSIEFKLEMVDFGKTSKTETGVADLGGFFFLGSETDTDEITNVSYSSIQYSTTTDSCYTNIRIGNKEDSPEKSLLAKIEKNCNGEIMTINLDNFPNLREK